MDTDSYLKKIQKFFYSGYFILLLLCIPLLFVNIKSSHDWGDDFASYIHQAKNICQGIPQSQNGYVLNQDYPKMGPPAYPIGFPLMLSPVYYLFGNSIHAFTLFLSVLLILSALLMYRFFKFHFRSVTSLFLVLIIVYNPWVLNFKMEVMSEIPFTFFLLSILILYQFNKEEKNYFYYLLIGLSGGFLMSIRAAGAVFIMAVGIELAIAFYNFMRNRITIAELKKSALQKLIIIFSAIFLYLLLNVWLFRIPSSGFLYYGSVISFNAFGQLIRDHLSYNFQVFQNFFATENQDWQFLPLFTQAAMLTFAVIGFIKKIFQKFDFTDLVVLLYCISILVYPYGNAGFRFLIPISAILLYYAVTAVKDIKINFTLIKRKFVIVLLGMLILIQYKVGIERIIREQKLVNWGPQETSAVEAFEFIKTYVPENSLIEFEKPRALALYTGRNGFHIKINQPLNDIKKNFKKVGVSYILHCNEAIDFWQDDSLKKYLQQDSTALQCVWQNNNFKLYKIKE
jgi:4-amino-4-deoxy-L-arabinose transferase-like glycosyltransferase